MRRRDLSPQAYLLLGVTFFLVLGGILMIYSASSVADYVKYQDSAYHLKKQVVFALLGAVALFATSRWDFTPRRGSSAPQLLSPSAVAWGLWGISLAGLIVVEGMGVGKWGATRSIDLGFGYVQPSEFAKLGCLLVVAVLLVDFKRGRLAPKAFLGRLALVLVPVVGLIMAQPDMGTTMSLVLAVALLLWLGGIDAKWLGLVAAVGVPSAVAAVMLAGYRMQRLTAFLDPWADPMKGGYQIIQSLYAFGSGGLFGQGLGLSRQKFFYLPAAHTDFIFAVIGEELGLIGALAVVLAFALFAWSGMRIAISSKSAFGRLLAGGLTGMIVIQALMNMAAVTGLMPITGIPLPFVSAGGSSLTLTLACVGLILSVARSNRATDVRLVKPAGSERAQRANTLEWRRNGRPRLSGADGSPTTRRTGA